MIEGRATRNFANPAIQIQDVFMTVKEHKMLQGDPTRSREVDTSKENQKLGFQEKGISKLILRYCQNMLIASRSILPRGIMGHRR